MLIEKEIKTILDKFYLLNYDAENQSFIGYVIACEKDDDRYLLEINVANFPQSFPKVYEIGERIPRKTKRHINKDNSFCFTTKIREEIYLKSNIYTLSDFFQLVLIPFLQNNSYYELNKEYKFGEYSHDFVVAFIETFEDILKIKNPYTTLSTINKAIKNEKIRPNELCFCGSNKKIKNCDIHENAYKDIKKISKKTLEFAQNIFSILILYIEKNNVINS